MTRDHDATAVSPSRAFRQRWRVVLGEGILLVMLGAAAFLLPLVAGLVVALVLGWLLFLAGLLGLASSAIMRQTPGFWWSLLSSIAALVTGALLFIFPLGGMISLTLLLAIFLFADGIVTIALALAHRGLESPSWGWLLLNGVLDMGLAMAIFAFLPNVAAWVVGTIVGVDLIFGGISLIVMAASARQRAG